MCGPQSFVTQGFDRSERCSHPWSQTQTGELWAGQNSPGTTGTSPAPSLQDVMEAILTRNSQKAHGPLPNFPAWQTDGCTHILRHIKPGLKFMPLGQAQTQGDSAEQEMLRGQPQRDPTASALRR